MKTLKELLLNHDVLDEKAALHGVKEWLIQKRQEVTERRRNGEAFFGNQILNELLNDILDELNI